MKKFAALRAKTDIYLTASNNKDKKTKGSKTCLVKRKLKFEDYRHCLETAHLENKINNLEKNNINTYSIWEHRKEFMRNTILIVKSQQRFKSEKHNVFTEKVSKIALSANDDERIWWIVSIEIYAYGANKYHLSEKEKIKFNNIIKRYKNDISFIVRQNWPAWICYSWRNITF